MLFIFYYIDTSVLQENILLVKFIKTTSRTRVVYCPYIGKYFLIIGKNFLYVKALNGKFYIFNEFVSLAHDKISLEKYISCTTFVYIIKRTLHGGLKIWILFSRGKNENKIHIFAPPCNMLYIITDNIYQLVIIWDIIRTYRSLDLKFQPHLAFSSF